MSSTIVRLVLACSIFISLSSSFFFVHANEDVATGDAASLVAEDECNKIAFGDHVLFSYHTRFENGTAGPSVSDTSQPIYFQMQEQDNELGIFGNFVGLCENSTNNVHYDSLVEADLRPIVREGSELYDLDESFDMTINIQKVTKNEDYQIFQELRTGNISMVLDLIDEHKGINAMDEYGQTPLMIAVSRQYLPVVASLLNTRRPLVNINQAKSSGFTALFYAVEKATPSIVQALLRRGADPNMVVLQSGGKGNTPLHFACMLEKPKHAHLLLDYGANPYLKNEHNMIPYQLVPRDAVPSSRLQYKTMFNEIYKKLAQSENDSSSQGEL
jgi:hypothetical protein